MSILIKNKVNPKIYKRRVMGTISSNQTEHRTNYIQEVMLQQKEINDKLVHFYQQINTTIQASKSEQQRQYHELLSRFVQQETKTNELLERINRQELPVLDLIKRLDSLDQKHAEFVHHVEAEGYINQAIMDELSHQNQNSQQHTRKAEEF